MSRIARICIGLLTAAAPSASFAAAEKEVAACVASASDPETCIGRTYNACLVAAPEPDEDAAAEIWRARNGACWRAEAAAWDAALELVNLRISAGLEARPPAASHDFRSAHQAWIAFRDADCAWPRDALAANDLHNVAAACGAEAAAARVGRLKTMQALLR